MATMKEIAALAGLSRGTVDRVLNGRGHASQKTVDKVMQAAKELNYTPSRVARSLAVRKQNLLFTFLLPNPAVIPFFSQVERGAVRMAAYLRESSVELRLRHASGWSEAEYLRLLDEAAVQHCNGIAIAGPDTESIAKRLAEISSAGIPVITVNTDIKGSGRLAYVGSDAYQAGRTAAGLIDLLTRDEIHLGIVFGDIRNSCHMERIAGMRDGLRALGRQWQEHFFVCNNEDHFDSYDLMKDSLRRFPEVNMLYIATGNGVYGCCRAIEKLGLKRPPRVICHDESASLRELFDKGLLSATICQEPRQQGKWPLRILFDYLALGVPPAQEVFYTGISIFTRENFIGSVSGK